MANLKQVVPLSFKVSTAMKTRLDQECETENRSNAEMAKILIAEALLIREANRSINKIL